MCNWICRTYLIAQIITQYCRGRKKGFPKPFCSTCEEWIINTIPYACSLCCVLWQTWKGSKLKFLSLSMVIRLPTKKINYLRSPQHTLSIITPKYFVADASFLWGRVRNVLINTGMLLLVNFKVGNKLSPFPICVNWKCFWDYRSQSSWLILVLRNISQGRRGMFHYQDVGNTL